MDSSEMRKAAIIMARAAELNTRVSGMVAENSINAIRDEYPAFTNNDFERVINETGCHWNQICEVMQGY